MTPVVLLGLGFTTRRLAKRLLLRGCPVFGVVRQGWRYTGLAALGARVIDVDELKINDLPDDSVLVNTIPPDNPEPLRNIILRIQPRRIIYISSTSVYGKQLFVNAETPAAPGEDKGRRRLDEEAWTQAHFASSLIVRPAGIYGPGRGVHTRLLEGTAPRSTGAGIVSRIHVDDLAAVIEAGVLSEIEGAWPLADDYPCSSDEIIEWCANLLGTPRNAAAGAVMQSEGRTVDGAEIRSQLGVKLLYADYRAGILASLSQSNEHRRSQA